MADRLPPLTALRAFEAAGRHENFSRAADELHVTHGAISHQVKALEAFLDVPLFARQGRGVAVNADGRALAQAVAEALAGIDAATRAIRRRHDRLRLTISVLPSFGARWLMPRIGKFMARHPTWEVNIESDPALVDFARGDVDVAIRFGKGRYAGLHSERLMDDDYIMVAGPRLFRGRVPKDPRRLTHYPLLRADAEPWAAWCAAAGIDLALPSAGVDFQDMGVMLQSAIDGLGIMLSRRAVASSEIARGSLVQVFDVAARAQESYWIVWPIEPPPSDRVLAFRDWLRGEAHVADPPEPRGKQRAILPNARRRAPSL